VILREVVLPTALVYTGVVVLLIAAAATSSSRKKRRTVVVVAEIILGGTATFMLAMSVYCSARGVAFGPCIAEPLRGAVPLAIIAALGFAAIELGARALRR